MRVCNLFRCVSEIGFLLRTAVFISVIAVVGLMPAQARADEAGVALVQKVLASVKQHQPAVCDYRVTTRFGNAMLVQRYHRVLRINDSSNIESPIEGELPFESTFQLSEIVEFLPGAFPFSWIQEKTRSLGKQTVEGETYEVVEVVLYYPPVGKGAIADIPVRWYVGADNQIHRITARVPFRDFDALCPPRVGQPVNPVNPLANERVDVDAVLIQMHSTARTAARRATNSLLPLRIPTVNKIATMTLSPNGVLLARSRWDESRVSIYDTGTGIEKWVLQYGTSPVRAMQFSQDGALLACGTTTRVCLWDIRTGKFVTAFNTGATGVEFADGGRRLLTYSIDGSPRVWNTRTGREAFIIPREDREKMLTQYATLAPDGRRLAIASSSHNTYNIEVWDVDSGQRITNIKGDGGTSAICTFSPDSQTLAFQRENFTVRIYNAETGATVRDLAGAWGELASLTYLDDETLLAIDIDECGYEPAEHAGIVMWNTTNGKVRESRELTNSMFETEGQFVVAPSGRRVLQLGANREVRIWDLAETQP